MSTASNITYEFVAPHRVVFGWGRRREVGSLARTLGRRMFVVCGSRTLQKLGLVDQITQAAAAAGVVAVGMQTISREPQVEDVDRTAARLREGDALRADFILAIGGGAAIDMAKALAAMATNCQSPTVRDYLEGVGRGLKLDRDPLPVLAMPTTAGTGSEATKNAVVCCYDPPFKKSLRDERLVPRIALIDPELTVSTPPAVTASSGMDAITQLLESYISRKARPIPQALAAEGLKLAVPALAEAVENGSARTPRQRMAHAALLSGMCLANSGLGMAHGVAAALGVHARVPHGAACALMLPAAVRANRQVACQRLACLSRMLFGSDPATSPEQAVEVLIERIDALCDRVGTPRRLSEVGVTAQQIPAIVASSRGNSMSGNPRELSDEELAGLLEQML